MVRLARSCGVSLGHSRKTSATVSRARTTAQLALLLQLNRALLGLGLL
jgi:hypothetical protein